jgi:hypothetical protein
VAPSPEKEVVAMSATVRWCSPCGSEQLFEVPPCEDGHGEDCLDLSCVECGHAVVVGILVSDGDVLLEVRAA